MTVKTLYATADSTMKVDVPTTNFGSSMYLMVGEANTGTGLTRRTLIKFDVSAIPAVATVVTAVLRLYCDQDSSSNARTYSVYRVIRPWVETEATWNKATSSASWATAGCSGLTDREGGAIGSREFSATETLNEFKEFDLDAAKVQEWISGETENEGVLVKAATEADDFYRFHSRENTNPPQLVITYTVPGANFAAVFIG